QEWTARMLAPAWIDASTLSVATRAMTAFPDSSTRTALASPVTWTISDSDTSIHPFCCATRYGSENVVTGPGNTILILAATATGASMVRAATRERVQQNRRHRTRW